MKYFINYKDEFSSKMLLALVIFLVIFPKTSSANYIPASGSQYPHVAPSPSVSHGRSTGIRQEKECFVARLCEYKILENFSCKVSEYVISNGLERTLPKWLWFDERNQTLKGIPSPVDEGLSEILITGLNRHQTKPIDYICGLLTVKIIVWNLKYFPLFTQNVPTSPVINDKFSKPSAWQGFTCQFNEPIVLASLVMAGNFHEMGGKQKINVLDELLQSYHISIYDVFMLPNKEDSLSGLLQTSHVLASGPGANRSASGLSTTVTWHVRCGVIHLDDALFQALEKLSRQLTFINNVSYAPIGWHVVTGFQRHHVRRRRNVVGTTTPAYSTVPISRATVITTKIKITRTTYVTATRTLIWTRPLPTFSSPHTANKTSLYNQSSTISSGFYNTITPSQYNSVSSTSLVMPSLSNTMSSLSQIISPSKYERSGISQYKSVSSTLLPVMSSSGSMPSLSPISTLEISQLKNVSSTNMFSISLLSPSRQTLETSKYESVFSTLPVISQSRNKSAIFQISSSAQQTSSSSIKTSSKIYPTSGVTRLDSLKFTSKLPSSKLSTFIQSSLTTSTNQRSTYVIVPSSRNITPSVPSAVQTVINNNSISSTIFHSLSNISSLVVSSLFTAGHYLTSTSKVSIIWSTTTMTKATQPNNSTTSLLQSSYSDFIDSVSQSTSRTHSPMLHVTTSRIINETKSNNLHQTSYESSTAHTRSVLYIMTTPSTNNVVTAQRSPIIDPSYIRYTSSSGSSLRGSSPTPSPFLSCTNSCLGSTFSKNVNFTLTSGEQQYTTTLYQASVIRSETTLSSSRITGTSVLNTRSVTPQTSEYVCKTPESPVLTSGIVSKSLQSSDYITSKSFKTLTTNSTIYSSSLGSRSSKIIPSSSSGAMTSQRTSGSRTGSTFTSTLVKTTFTGKTLHIMTSQSSSEHKSSLSPVSSTARSSTAIVYTPTEQLRSTYSSLIKTTPASTYTLSVQTKTIGSGSLITNIVPNHSVSSLFTPHISGAVSSYITRSDVGHSSMTGSIDQSAFQTRPSNTLSPHIVSFSSLGNSPSSSNKDFKMSTLTVLKTTSSPVFPSFYQTPTYSPFATVTPSPVVSSHYTPASSPIAISTLSSYTTATSRPSVIASTPSSHQLPSFHTTSPLSTFATIAPSSYLLSSHTAATLTSIVDAFASSSVYALYRTPTSPSLAASTTLSFPSLSSYNTGTSPPSVITTTIPPSLFPSSYHTHTSPLSFSTISLSSSYHSSTLHSSVVTITALSHVLSHTTGTSQSSVIATIPSSDQLPSSHTTSPLSTFATIAPSSYLLSSHTAATLTSIVDAFASSSVYALYRTPTSPSLAASTTLSFPSLSSYNTGTSPSSVITTTIPPSLFPSSYHTHTSPLSFSTISLSSSYHSSTLHSSVVTITVLSHVLSHTTGTSQSSVIATIPSSDQLPSSHTTSTLTVGTITPSSYLLTSYTKASSTSSVVKTASSSIYVSYRIPTLPSFAVTSTPSPLSSNNTGTLPPPIVTTTPSSNVVSSYHSSTSLPSVFTTPSYLLSHHKRTPLLTFVNTIISSYHTVSSPSFSSAFPSSYHTPTSVRSSYNTLSLPSSLAAITSPVFLSSYHTRTSPSSVGAVTPSSEVKSLHYTITSLHTSNITPFLNSQTGHITATSPSSLLAITSSPDYLSSYHTSPSSATITRSSDLLSSYHTQASSSVATITPSSSYHTPTSPLSPVTITSSLYHTPTLPSSVATITSSVYLSYSYNAVLSSFSPATDTLRTSPSNLPSSSTTLSSTSHKTFSLSFLSSSIVSSKPSISSDLSTGSYMSYTLTKLSAQTSWLARPSYTWQSPHTTTVVLTLTSVKIPVITSRSGVIPSSTSSQSSSTVVTRPTIPSKESPKIYNNFDLLRVTVGKVFSVQIPVDTFHDREDGNTRNLRLECLTVAHARLTSNSWLQFNSTTQTLYGLVLKSQLGTIPSEYLLSASDHDGNTVYDAFTVIIKESSKVLAAMFSVELTGINLEMFNRDIDNVLSTVQTIAGYYGDTDESMIQVLSLMEGSVIFTWSNTSLQTCDEYLINDIASKLITRQGNVQQDFYNALSPRYIANNVFVNYTGPCVVPSTENPSVSELSSHETSPWLKYVLPSLAVTVVIVVIVVAFLLVRRRSGVKILKEDKQTFKRRKPIILDDEQEMSTLCGKPIELPEDSLSPIRFPRESSLGTPEYDEDGIPELPSPILPAPSYQRLPPRYSGGYNRYNTPPPPYKLPPSY